MRIVATFPYLQVIHPVVGRLFQPVAEVELSHGAIHLRHLLFLDSGADISVIPASLGLALGLHREEQPTASVRSLVAERTLLSLVEIHLQLGNAAAVPVRVGWANDDNVPPLLGRLDAFEYFTFEFNHERRMVIVKQ